MIRLRTRLHRKIKWIENPRKLLRPAIRLLCCCCAVLLLIYAAPGLTSITAKIGLVSVGWLLPEGGLSLLGKISIGGLASDPTSFPETSDHTLPIVDTPPIEESQAESQLEENSPSAESAEESTASIPLDPPILEENKAILVQKTYTAAPSSIYLPLDHGFIKNCTSHTANEIYTALENPPAFSLSSGSEPQVLIMHTHTTESYLPFTGAYYDKTYASRSTDNSQNMVAVGDKIAAALENYGIGVLHDTTQHDYPSYNGSYNRSYVTVQNYLTQYPSIKVVLDIHRDAIISSDGAITAPVAEIEGKTAAQVMIIAGCDDGTMNHPNYMQNLSFAAVLQTQIESDHPGLTRPILFDYRYYNQSLSTGSLLIEVGGHANTLDQALYSGELIGNSLGKLLSSMIS